MLTIGQSFSLVIIAVIVIGLASTVFNDFVKAVMLTFGVMLFVCAALNCWYIVFAIPLIAIIRKTIIKIIDLYNQIINKKNFFLIALGILIIGTIFVVSIYILITNYANYRQQKNIETFQTAIAYVESNQYYESLELLESLPSDFVFDSVDSYDIYKLRTYIRARMEYPSDNIDVLKSLKEDLETVYPHNFSNVSDNLASDMEQFINEVNEDYDIRKRESLKGVAPYKGMSEDDLLYTELGKPYKIEKSLNWDVMPWYRRHKTYMYLIKYEKKYYQCIITVSYDDSGDGTVHSIYTFPVRK